MAALPLPPPPRSQPIRVACRAPPPPDLKGLRPRVPGVGGPRRWAVLGDPAWSGRGSSERTGPALAWPERGPRPPARLGCSTSTTPQPNQSRSPSPLQTGPVLPHLPQTGLFPYHSPRLAQFPLIPHELVQFSITPPELLRFLIHLQPNQPSSRSLLNQPRPLSCSQSRPLPPHHLSVHPTLHSPSTPQGLDSGLAKALSLLYSPTAR